MCYSARFCSAHCVKLFGCAVYIWVRHMHIEPFTFPLCIYIPCALRMCGNWRDFFFSLSCVSVISCLLQFSHLALVFASYWCCTFALHPFKCVCVWIVGSILHAVLSTAFKCAFRFMPLLSTTHQFTLCMSCETPPILKSACQREMENICVWVCVCLFHIN